VIRYSSRSDIHFVLREAANQADGIVKARFAERYDGHEFRTRFTRAADVMHALRLFMAALLIVSLLSLPTSSQPRDASAPVLYEGARLIIGDTTASIDNGAFIVQNGRFTVVGPRGSVTAPVAARRVDLAGKTVMPAMVNAHVHIGYEGYTTWRAENHTPQNVMDHLRREAFYGVAAVTSVGTSPTAQALEIQRDQQAGKFPPAARFLFLPGMAPPGGGPDAVLIVATNKLGVINEVSTPEEARARIRRMAEQKIRHVKMWVDDRGGSYPKLQPDTYTAIIDEAHQHGMVVHAHAIQLADQKAVVRAGADVLVHMVQRQPLDDEYLALLREKKPYWATVIGLGDPTEVCRPDPFFEQALPPQLVVAIRATTERKGLAPSCGRPSATAAQREEQMARNFPQYLAAGARVVLGTDTGIHPGHTFGSGEHVELARWVQLGMTPADAIIAATSRPAQLMGLDDLGSLTKGNRASFIVLDANPLENIRNTRKIVDVYLDGERFNREGLIAEWRTSWSK
jgi:imidazolonepropionase-like amidohydrolase